MFILFFTKTVSLKWDVVTYSLEISVISVAKKISNSLRSTKLFSSSVFLQEAMKDYQEKKVRGELISQRVDFLKQKILSPVIS